MNHALLVAPILVPLCSLLLLGVDHLFLGARLWYVVFSLEIFAAIAYFLWEAGKGRRAESLPLPRSTGEALVDYIQNERPQTDCRMIFVRNKPPVGLPVGRRVVQRAIQDAYARLGWNRSRVHILRHTLATHLISAGAPVPQVADVLRHRDITTTSIYARVDANHLSLVAMPWPGSVD